jgi:hypothetical protein
VAARASHVAKSTEARTQERRPLCLFFADRMQEHDKQEHTTMPPVLRPMTRSTCKLPPRVIAATCIIHWCRWRDVVDGEVDQAGASAINMTSKHAGIVATGGEGTWSVRSE